MRIIFFLSSVILSCYLLFSSASAYVSVNIYVTGDMNDRTNIAYSLFPKEDAFTTSSNSRATHSNYAYYKTIPSKFFSYNSIAAFIPKGYNFDDHDDIYGNIAIFDNFGHLIADIGLLGIKQPDYALGYQECADASILNNQKDLFLCYKIKQYSTIVYPTSDDMSIKTEPYELVILPKYLDISKVNQSLDLEFNYIKAF